MARLMGVIPALRAGAAGKRPPACVGDCDGGGDVTVNEIIILVNIDLGTADASACPYGIPSDSRADITLIARIGVQA